MDRAKAAAEARAVWKWVTIVTSIVILSRVFGGEGPVHSRRDARVLRPDKDAGLRMTNIGESNGEILVRMCP